LSKGNASITVDVTKAVEKTRALQNIPKAVRYQLQKWGADTVRHLKSTVLSGRVLHVRSGQLRRSVRSKIIPSGDRYALHIGTRNSKYARILERGGTITPKRAKYLTVPFPGVKGRASNYPRYSKATKRGTFIMKVRGKLFIVEKRARSLKFLFTLKKKVKIPAFWWLRKTTRERKPKLDRMMSKPYLYATAKRMK